MTAHSLNRCPKNRIHFGHQAGLFVYEHLGNDQIHVLGVARFLPQRPTAREQPDVEFSMGAESFCTGSFLGGLLLRPLICRNNRPPARAGMNLRVANW